MENLLEGALNLDTLICFQNEVWKFTTISNPRWHPP